MANEPPAQPPPANPPEPAAQGVAAAAAPPVAPPAAPPAVVAFALSPATALLQQVIDYSTTAGIKLFASATKKLPNDYDLKPENLKLFLLLRFSTVHASPVGNSFSQS
jgi:hypothetical protein